MEMTPHLRTWTPRRGHFHAMTMDMRYWLRLLSSFTFPLSAARSEPLASEPSWFVKSRGEHPCSLH